MSVAAFLHRAVRQLGRVSAAGYFKAHSDKGQFEELLNRNGFSDLSELGEAPKSTRVRGPLHRVTHTIQNTVFCYWRRAA
jgi:hypothetical protein